MSEHHLIADRAGERLDVFLARTNPTISRSSWQKRCESGLVQVNGQSARTKLHLHEGDDVSINMAEQPDFTAHDLPILYEDDDVIVINKPAGLLTHAKGAENVEFTVAEFVRTRTTDGLDTNRPGIVHRLDRGTSGVLIAAKHAAAKQWLQAQFSKRNVKKTYLALVEGHLKEPEAIIRLPIGRSPARPQTFRVDPNGKPAETSYHVEQAFAGHDLLLLKPLTGRTHQLRVHLHYLGHPIVGDSIYGHPDIALGRMFLHAHTLELTLPSGERKTFIAPLPSELQTYLDSLDRV